MNLIEGLLQEMNRVRELIKVYEEYPNTEFAIAMFKEIIANAESAIAANNIVAMLQYFEQLKGCE